MASGIEVAGLVLAVLPLVISAMEHYADGVSTLGRYRKYKLEIKTLINTLQTERAKLINTYERLLIDLVPPWEIESMIDDPFGPLWKDATLENKIRRRLWKNYDIFHNTVLDMQSAMEEMKTRLGLFPDGIMKWSEGRLIVRELKRAAFSLRKSRYDDLMTRIKEGVSSLDTLTGQSIELEPHRMVRSQGRLFKVAHGIAKSLHCAVQSSLACGGNHDLGMQATTWFADKYSVDDPETASKTTCSVAISRHKEEEACSSAWGKVEVQELPRPLFCTKAEAQPAAAISYQEGNSLWGKALVLWTGSMVSTRAENSMGSTGNTYTMVQPETVSALRRDHRHGNTGAQLIPSSSLPSSSPFFTSPGLCQALSEAHTKWQASSLPANNKQKSREEEPFVRVIDYSFSGERPRRFGVACAPGANPSAAISLRQILEGTASAGVPPLSYGDKMHLAVAISSSVLQLYRTSWIPETLSIDDIFFLQTSGPSLLGPSNSFYEQAFLTKRPVPTQTSLTRVEAQLLAACNMTVLSLGIVLIELILGKPIRGVSKDSSSSSSGKAQETNFLAIYSEERGLLNEMEQKSSRNYSRAVRGCFNYHAQFTDRDSEGDDFRHNVYGNVVAFLEKDLKATRWEPSVF